MSALTSTHHRNILNAFELLDLTSPRKPQGLYKLLGKRWYILAVHRKYKIWENKEELRLREALKGEGI